MLNEPLVALGDRLWPFVLTRGQPCSERLLYCAVRDAVIRPICKSNSVFA